MEIKRNSSTNHPTANIPRIRKIRIIFLTASITTLIMLVGGLLILKKLSPQKFEAFKKVPFQVSGAALDHLKSWAIPTDPMYLAIKPKQLQKLNFMRNQALKSQKSFEYVPATISWKGADYPIKIRLKGDRFIHFQHEDKWSFRVQIKDGKAIDGLRKFSLHRAGARNYLYEWLFLEMLKEEGMLALHYEFLPLYVNGKYLGIYALEEHFDKPIVERNGYRDGPILKFDESLDGENPDIGAVLAFKENSWTTTDRKPILEKAVSQLEAFRLGQKPINKVFAVSEFARLFAIADLLGMHHATMWKSLRLYYNPVSGLLHPIGYDGHFQPEYEPYIFLSAEVVLNPKAMWNHDWHSEWFRRLFNDSTRFDPVFYEEYVHELDRLSQPGYLESFYEKIAPQIQHNLQLINKDFLPENDHVFWYGPDGFSFDFDRFYDHRNYIKEKIHPSNKVVHVYRGEYKTNRLNFEVANLSALPIELTSIKIGTYAFPIQPGTFSFPGTRLHFGYPKPEYKSFHVAIPSNFTWADSLWNQAQLTYRIIGMEDSLYSIVHPWSRFDRSWESEDLLQRPTNVQDFPFLAVNETLRTITFSAGICRLETDLIIGSGYTVLANSGTHIQLTHGSSIMSRSAFKWVGTEEKPIQISSPDGTGQGLVILQSQEISEFEHVVFNGLTPPTRSNWQLSGAVTAYQSAVKFQQVSWINCIGEDGLNLIQSPFEIENCFWGQNSGDALDIDFSEGKIQESRFIDSGNDAIDVSGSSVEMAQILISQAGDKGISLGEKSVAKIESVQIKNAIVAIAIKDQSHLQANRIRLETCDIGVAVYQKKPEYGAATSEFSELFHQNIRQPFLVEKGSSCTIDENIIPATVSDLRQQIDSLGNTSMPNP